VNRHQLVNRAHQDNGAIGLLYGRAKEYPHLYRAHKDNEYGDLVDVERDLSE